MVNEEDHLRIQVMLSGFSLDEAWEQINQLDDQLEEQLAYAFSPQLGYLTACPTNVGTGIRVSVMLHLPALVQTKQIDKVFRALQKINLAVRGLYGEGTQAFGDFYQISNQVTLGKSEDELIRNLSDVVPQIIEYERTARQALLNERRQHLHDQVSRAYGILKTAQTISSEETMHLLSSVRMGINLGLIDDLAIATVNELFIQTQPAHLQKIQGTELGVEERNVARASYLRSRLVQRPARRVRVTPRRVIEMAGGRVAWHRPRPRRPDARRTGPLPRSLPVSSISLQISPHAVLGVADDASLQQIRDAYHTKAKKYHPDAGGEEWAFRILVQAYETLSQARVMRAAHVETEARPTPRAPAGWTHEKVRPGVQDEAADPARVVAIESFWIRYQDEYIWLRQDAPAEERFLSCSLNIAWPDPALPAFSCSDEEARMTLKALGDAFEAMRLETNPVSSGSNVEDHQFSGWLSYPDIRRATAAFERLREDLHARGLGIRQWTRDLIIPRDWR